MAGSVATLSNNSIASGSQSVSKAGSERAVQKDVGDLGKALKNNDVELAQSLESSLKSAAPTQNGKTEFSNAVKALDQALKSGDAKAAAEAFDAIQKAQRRITQGPRANVADVDKKLPGVLDLQKQGTVQIQKANVADQSKQVNERAFITRKDIETRSAEDAPKALPGQNIHVTA